MNRPSVLVVEDNPDSRFLFERLLGRQYEVTLAEGASEAASLAEAIRIDLFLFDIHLGQGPSGVDLLRRLRAHPRFRHTPALACTAYVEPKDKDELFDAGFDAYLSKPFTPSELRETLGGLSRPAAAS